MADTTTVRFAKETTQVHKRFDIDKSETVITHYACAHKGRVLKQGRLYITQNYLCFYAQVVGKVHKKTINFADVSDLNKANFGVFPNAIKITTRKNKEIVFASFLMRDQAYDAIRQEWLSLSNRVDFEQKEKEREKEKEKEKEKKSKSKDKKKDKRNSASHSPTESESDAEEKKKKKKRWSFTKRKSDASDSMNSDSDIGSDVSSSKSKRRGSTSSTSSLERHSSGKDSEPTTPEISSVRRASCTAAPVSAPFSLSSSSSSSTPSPSSARKSSSSVPPSPSPSPSPTPSRGERAQALIDSGNFVTVPLELSAVNTSTQNCDGTSQAGDQSEAATNPPSLWQRMCSCF